MYFTANWKMRGSRTLVTRPKFAAAKLNDGSSGWTAFSRLNASTRSSIRCDAHDVEDA